MMKNNKNILIFTLTTLLISFFAFSGSIKADVSCESLKSQEVKGGSLLTCEADTEAFDCTSSNNKIALADVITGGKNFVCRITFLNASKDTKVTINFKENGNEKTYGRVFTIKKNINVTNSGESGTTVDIRKEDVNPSPDSYASFYNNQGQYIDPSTGQTISGLGEGSTGGSIVLGTSGLSQGVCQDFNVCYTGQRLENAYGSGQHLLEYNATSTCSGSGNNYVAFCLDPGSLQASRCSAGGDEYHADSIIDINSPVGKTLYALYKLYDGDTSLGGRAKWQAAARIIQFKYSSYFGTQHVYYKNHHAAWQSWATGGGGSGYVEAGRALANQAEQMAATINPAQTSGTVNITFEQAGAVVKNGGSFEMDYRLVLTGFTGTPSVEFSWLKAGETDTSNASSSAGGMSASLGACTSANNITTCNVKVTGPINDGNCEIYQLLAKVKYGGDNDLRSIMVVRNKKNTSKQRFLVFESGGGEVETIAATTVNPGNNTCDEPGGDTPSGGDPCVTEATLACGTDGNNYITINEGAVGDGETDWEGCIIHKTDVRGNSYDIEVQDKYITTELGEYYKDESQVGQSGETVFDEELQDNLRGKLISKTGGLKYGNYDILFDSQFCTISCKEKYEFVLPENKTGVYKGTYFSFNIAGAEPDNRPLSLYHAIVGVQAERKCVTSGVGGGGSDVNTDNYEKRVINLRRQQIDFMNAYEYFTAMHKKLSEEDVKQKYIAEAGQGVTLIDGPNLGNYVSGKTSEMLRAENNIIDPTDQWYAAHIMAEDFEFKQYRLTITGNDETKAEIEKIDSAGRTDRSFRNKESGTIKEYHVDDKYNGYTGAYDEAYIFDELANIAQNQEIVDGSYHWRRPITRNGIVVGYEEGDDDSHVYYQRFADRFKTYDMMLQRIESLAKTAKAKAESLSKQIDMQSSSIITCTKYLDSMEANNNGYKFDPKIIFEYDQPNYMSMMGSSRLTLASEEGPTLNVSMSYCNDGSGSAAGAFDCGGDKDETEFKYFDAGGSITSAVYNDVKRAASTSTYTCDGGYCYYRNATQFLTYPPDGIVTTNKNVNNATYIEHDGRVYPVTITTYSGVHEYYLKFEQIGQYFETNYLGRIMGGSGGKLGTMVGEARDSAVCTYDVPEENDDDDDCDPEVEECDNTCSNIVEESCAGGNYASLSTGELSECINNLLAKHDDNGQSICCGAAEKAFNEYKKMDANPDVVNKFNTACPNGPKTCTGYKIVTATTASSAYDQALVNDRGELQFTVRTVSLNNLFPNGKKTKGRNWSDATSHKISGDPNQQTHGLTIAGIIQQIQNNGESIYGGTPDYSCTMTPTCIKSIQEYNKQHEEEGGLSDYDLTINTEWDSNTYTASRAYDEGDEFYNNLKKWGCTCSYWRTSDKIEGISK